MKRFEKLSQSPEAAGLFMAQTMQCYACPITNCSAGGKSCARAWEEYLNEDLDDESDTL